MNNVLKAKVIKGRYQGQTVRVTNVSFDDLGRKYAACILLDGTRFNILASDLEVIREPAHEEPKKRFAKTASMPFVSGAASSRTMTQTKNMMKTKPEEVEAKMTLVRCEKCGNEFDLKEGNCPHCEE